jgi:hypothetical protein
MKKLLFLFSLLFLAFGSRAQAPSQAADTPRYFAQCMLDIPDNGSFMQLESDLRANPNVQVARLDLITRRAFIVTQNLPSFSQEDFLSWLGSQAPAASCIQVGLLGTDQVRPYPFTNCND